MQLENQVLSHMLALWCHFVNLFHLLDSLFFQIFFKIFFLDCCCQAGGLAFVFRVSLRAGQEKYFPTFLFSVQRIFRFSLSFVSLSLSSSVIASVVLT